MPSPKKPASKPAARPAAKPVKSKPSKPIAEKPVAKPTPVKPAVPAKPAVPTPPPTPMDAAWLENMRQTLLSRRAQLTSVVQSNREQLASNDGDPADIADRASEGFEDELTAGLLTLEVAALDEVEAALERLDRGEYGSCVTCGKPISRKRLEILPFAKRCLKCEDEKERSIPMGGPGEAADDDDGDHDEEGDAE